MEIRPMTAADLPAVQDIDATLESDQFIHLLRQGEGLSLTWKLETRRLPQPRTHRNALTEDSLFTIRQIIAGVEDGPALVAEHDSQIIASAAAQIDIAQRVSRMIDLRVDFESRRQGLASAILFQIIHDARQRNMRAVSAQAASDNFPVIQLLGKSNFELTGFDTHFQSNHDLLKDSVTLFWYLQLD
jgi:ribosomal protein S18 acetylase RimI-like enzyme